MKMKALIIVILLMLTSISIAEAISIPSLNKKQENEEGNDGRIIGWVETQGHSMIIGVQNIKVKCGKNLKNYDTIVTDEYGFFEFSDLTYENTGTKYYIWIPPGQKIIFPGIKTVELNDEESEQDLYYYVYLLNLANKNKAINNLINQNIKNLVYKLNIEIFKLIVE